MLRQRALYYFFALAAVVSILDGAFHLDPTMQAVKYALLITTGLVVGVLIVEDQQKILVAGIGYSLGVLLISQLLATVLFFSSIRIMFTNFTLFVGMIILILGLEQFVSLITSEKQELKIRETQQQKQIRNKEKTILTSPNFQRIWAEIILISVGFTFVILLADLFFNTGRFSKVFFSIDIIVTIVFIIDVFLLYKKTNSFGEFITKNIFDIISAIPLVGIFRVLKIFRAIKILKTTKVLKLLKVNKTTKFFSEESAFNDVIEQKQKNTIKKQTKYKKQKALSKTKK